MKITLDIKESRFSTFMAFIKTLDYVSVPEEEMSIPDWQKKEADKRIKELEKHPEKAIDFDKTVSQIEKKYGL
jgi:hypothetical protein